MGIVVWRSESFSACSKNKKKIINKSPKKPEQQSGRELVGAGVRGRRTQCGRVKKRREGGDAA